VVTYRLLDLFSGAGGAAMGYHRAGFEVVGVDIVEQPNYPFKFILGDALAIAEDQPELLSNVDVIHASPPCQTFTAYRRRGAGVGDRYRDLVVETRALLQATELPYLIENVPTAPLREPVQICGSSFGLDIRRHRLFESNVHLVVPPCNHDWQTPRFPPATNRTNRRSTVEVGTYRCEKLAPQAMGIDWMHNAELSQAVPPTYTEFLGRQMFAYLRARDEAAGVPA
jgi:DNA (cytosine-5)-methyltransferase 1